MSRIRVASIVLFLFALATGLSAQGAGSIEGRVTTSDGIGVGGVIVIVDQTGAQTMTDAAGRFTLPAVAPGSYNLSFVLGDDSEAEPVEVAAGEVSRVEKTVAWDVSFFETITVTSASRRVERIVEAPAAITTVPAEEISQLGSTGQLAKVLEFTPGVEVTQSGLYDYNLNTRGFNSSLNRRVAVRIDGRDPAVGFLASQDWSTAGAVMEDAASLELLRGPSAALYGANAFNGVLNVTTKAPKDSAGGMVKLSGGELATRRFDVRLAGELGAGWYGKLLGGYSESNDWYRSRNATVEYAGLDRELIPLVLTDDEIWYASARLDRYFSGGRHALSLEYGDANAQGPLVVTGIGRVQVTDNKRPWGRLNFNGQRFNFLASYTTRNADDQRSLRSGVPLYLDSTRLNLELQGNQSFANDRVRVVGGVSYKEEDIDSADPSGRQTLMFRARDEDFSAVFGQIDFDLSDSLKLVFAARYDESSLHDSQFSPKGALVWSLNETNTVRVTYNEAFQVPNYSEFFLQADVAPPSTALGPVNAALCRSVGVDCGLDVVRVMALGNESLDVEKIKTWELGYSGILAEKAFLTIDYYNNQYDRFITDLINFIDPTIGRINPNFGPYTPPAALPAFNQAALLATLRGALGPTFAVLSNNLDGSPVLVPVSYTNFGDVESQGVDLGLNWYVAPSLTLDFTYSWFDFDVKRELAADPILPNAAENRFAFGIAYSGERYGGSIRYRYSDSFPWSAGVFKGSVPSYDVVDLGARYQLTEDLELGLQVSNLLDDDSYQTFGGDLIGRRALASLTYNW